jgi:cyclophilin family peptidyl-prolyl cis-trans isomerase
MPSAQKRRVLEKTSKREKRGRTYLIAIILLIAVVGVAWYVYAAATAPKPDFIVAAPSGVTIHATTPTTLTINVTSINQFSGTVLLTAKVSSTGLNVSINPASVTGSGTATLTASAKNNGSYSVTVSGASGSLTHAAITRVATPVFATFVTSKGNITVELYRAQAPQTVANFLNLAQSGFYTNLVWHRIHPGFVIQTGDPTTQNGGGNNNTWGQGHSQQTVPLEVDSSLHNYASYLGMARFGNDLNSGSSQFFINLADNSATLDGKYTVFGKVTSGMDVATAIGNVPIYTPPDGQPKSPYVFLTSVTITSAS